MDVAEISRLAAYEDWYWWHRARRRIIDRLLQRALGEGDATRRILDVGAGTGATSQALRKYGRVMAVDLSTEATIVARRRGLDVARMDAGNLAFPDASFDVVVVLDVIEHLEDDAAAVRELRRVLKPGGVLLATVPAYKWLWSSHDVANHHFRRYRQSELRRLLRGGDFHVEVCSYVMMSMLIPAAAYRLLEHLPGRKVADDEAHVRFIGRCHTSRHGVGTSRGEFGCRSGSASLPWRASRSMLLARPRTSRPGHRPGDRPRHKLMARGNRRSRDDEAPTAASPAAGQRGL